ncbi:predicted protein [Naegleria gruberi]|uniref:Predicted protein n=1 Tax=Naegleria gruberi TaxID=5762 RepID=D2VGN9_NAEGR|nr:uncharacterized protein NAEGRDRAFT_68045 [Naegleria gruberi]EFC44094.1 predicted protein [Naegleria gruberi]|eukprot:XP_002676838.1 predicted protein [Naegleria gruberi strain NEG-M]
MKECLENLKDNNSMENVNESNVGNNQRVSFGPFSLLFDYYGLYLPMPLDLAKERNAFQRSIFDLKIPMIVKSDDEIPKQQIINDLRFLNFNFDGTNRGYVINSYRHLLEGEYIQCLEGIALLTRNDVSSFGRDYLLYYMKSLCYFLLEDYVEALNNCEECINLMMNKEKKGFLESLNGSSTNSSIRMQPVLLYVWILYKMFEFSHAEMVLTMCTEEIFPFNAESHFNMAQFLVGVHGRKASPEIVEKIGNHLRKSLELYMNMGISISNSQTPKNTHMDYYPQNMYNSIFKYFNFYLHFLNVYNLANEGRQLISLFLHFTNDLLIKFKVAIKIDLTEEIAQYHNYESFFPIVRHPIELAYMLVSAARFFANTNKEKAGQLYKVASDLELVSYKEFNSPEFCLSFHCKTCGCLELFSIAKEYKQFLKQV